MYFVKRGVLTLVGEIRAIKITSGTVVVVVVVVVIIIISTVVIVIIITMPWSAERQSKNFKTSPIYVSPF